MHKKARVAVFVVLVAGFSLANGCATSRGTGGDNDTAETADVSSDVQGAPGHTDNQGGVLHKPGKSDPLTNCVACHGDKLQGDIGTSCSNCHDNADHTSSREGTLHRAGTTASCEVCHGPSNTGGLGPACSKCHGSDGEGD